MLAGRSALSSYVHLVVLSGGRSHATPDGHAGGTGRLKNTVDAKTPERPYRRPPALEPLGGL